MRTVQHTCYTIYWTINVLSRGIVDRFKVWSCCCFIPSTIVFVCIAGELDIVYMI